MNLRFRRTMLVATTTLLLATPMRLAAQGAAAPIDPDLPQPGQVIAEMFGTWRPLLSDASHGLILAEAPVTASDVVPAPIAATQSPATD